MQTFLQALFYFLSLVAISRCQDYEVADIRCNLYGDSSHVASVGSKQQLIARLKKPENFRGHPLFADDLKVNPRNDPYCSIVSEPGEITGRIYRLTITDLSRCGVTHHSGYVHVRIWFPLLPAAMTSHDQEVILVCKPPEPTILTSRVTELASTAPRQARVSGVVEESSSKLEYQVAVYRYLEEGQYQTQRSVQPNGAQKTSVTGPYLLPLDEAVPIGTRLQLRTHINPQTAWKYVKLVEVTVSTDRQDPHAEGHVRLLHLGCLTPEMKTLMRGQAKRLPTQPSEVWLDFEAFLLAPSNYTNESKRTRRQGQQWIHTTVLACLKEEDCRPGVCGDPTDPEGYGRRKRNAAPNDTSGEIQFDNRLAIQILVPEEKDITEGEGNCGMWIIPLGILIATTVVSLLLLMLTCRWNAQKKKELTKMGLPPNFTNPQRTFHLRQNSSR